MRYLLITIFVFLVADLNVYASENCGTYWLAGRPACSSDNKCKSSGVYIFKNTSNQIFIEIENYKLPKGVASLSADYIFEVYVNEIFEITPKKVEFISGPKPVKSQKRLRKGFEIIKKEKCKNKKT